MAIKIDKVVGKTNDVFQPIVDFANQWASFFGFDLKKIYKKLTGREEEDITMLTSAISKAFEGRDIKSAQMQDKINKALDNLIGLAKSPNIRNKISSLQNRLVKQNRSLIEDNAAAEVERTRLQGLANDIDNATFGEYEGSRMLQKRKEFQEGINKIAGTEQPNVFKNTNGYENVEEKI